VAGARADIVVSIVRAELDERTPAWHIDFEVRNNGDSTLWVIAGESLVFRQDDGRIELSYARGRLRPGAHAFGYFDPETVALAPGGTVLRSVEIGWPCRLNDLWNERREAAPAPGVYDVTVRAGYATTASPPAPMIGEGVEAAVFRWQREAVSQSVRISVPPYRRDG
jgi:hypothetical protein